MARATSSLLIINIIGQSFLKFVKPHEFVNNHIHYSVPLPISFLFGSCVRTKWMHFLMNISIFNQKIIFHSVNQTNRVQFIKWMMHDKLFDNDEVLSILMGTHPFQNRHSSPCYNVSCLFDGLTPLLRSTSLILSPLSKWYHRLHLILSVGPHSFIFFFSFISTLVSFHLLVLCSFFIDKILCVLDVFCRVDGLLPGLYILIRDPCKVDLIRNKLRKPIKYDIQFSYVVLLRVQLLVLS
jgi:hypothetical protein